MTNRRRSLLTIAATTVAVAIAASIGSAPVAHGSELEPVTIPARAVTEQDMPPIPSPEPALTTIGGVLGPDECRDLPSCHLVPLDIERPANLQPADDFYVILEMSWTSPEADLDTWLFDDGQKAEESGETGYSEIGSSAGGDNPETIKAFEPLYGRYNLLVNNFAGVAVTWHLKATSIVGDFVPPSESLAPAPGSGTHNPNNKPTTTTTTSTTTTTAPTTTTVSIPEAVVLPDDDFEGEEFDFDALTAEVDAAQAAAAELAANRAPKSPAALTVVLWMVVLPAALIGAGFLVLLRKRSRRTPPGPATAAS